MNYFRFIVLLGLAMRWIIGCEHLLGQPKEFRVGIIGNESDSFSMLLKIGAQTAASKLKQELNLPVLVDYRSMQKDSPEQQAELIEKLSVDGANVIIINQLIDDILVDNNIKSSVKSGVNVYHIHSNNIKKQSGLRFSIDDDLSMRLIAQEADTQLKGKGSIIVVAETNTVKTSAKRIELLQKYFRDRQGIQIQSIWQSDTVADTANQLRSHLSKCSKPDFWIFFNGNVLNHPEFAAAVDTKKALLVGNDLSYFEIVRSGKICTLFITPYKAWAEKAVDILTRNYCRQHIVAGEEIRMPYEMLSSSAIEEFSRSFLKRF